MNNIIDKADEIIDKINNSKEMKRIFKLKESINNDSNIQGIINEFNIKKDSITKVKLYNIDSVKEYILIQNEIDYLIMYLNKELNSLTNNKTCK